MTIRRRALLAAPLLAPTLLALPARAQAPAQAPADPGASQPAQNRPASTELLTLPIDAVRARANATIRHFASGQHDQIGVQVELHDLARRQVSVLFIVRRE